MARLPLLVLALVTLAGSLSGQILGARALPAGVPAPAPAKGTEAAPTAAVTPATVSRRFTTWDGFNITKLVFTFERGAAIEINQQRLGDWQKADRPAFAIAFTNLSAPLATFGISHFSGAAASALLAGNAWSSSPSSLTLNPKEIATIRALVNDDSALNTSMRRPFSWRTRVYEREIIPAQPGTPPLRQVRVAVGDDTQAYLFTLEGPAGHVADMKESFERLVTSFDLVR